MHKALLFSTDTHILLWCNQNSPVGFELLVSVIWYLSKAFKNKLFSRQNHKSIIIIILQFFWRLRAFYVGTTDIWCSTFRFDSVIFFPIFIDPPTTPLLYHRYELDVRGGVVVVGCMWQKYTPPPPPHSWHLNLNVRVSYIWITC